MVRYALTFLATGFVLCAQVGAQDGKDEAVKKDLAKLKGTWKIVSWEEDGKKMNAEKWLIKIDADGNMTKDFDGKTFIESTSKINPTKTPKTLDETFIKGGPGAGKTALWIYELKGDTLKICATAPGVPRPTEFKGHTLQVWERQKEK
jgi:uncharacterized protein (TIGR03067 family)